MPFVRLYSLGTARFSATILACWMLSSGTHTMRRVAKRVSSLCCCYAFNAAFMTRWFPGFGNSTQGIMDTSAYSGRYCAIPLYLYSCDCCDGILSRRLKNVTSRFLMLVALGRGPKLGSFPIWRWASSKVTSELMLMIIVASYFRRHCKVLLLHLPGWKTI